VNKSELEKSRNSTYPFTFTNKMNTDSPLINEKPSNCKHRISNILKRKKRICLFICRILVSVGIFVAVTTELTASAKRIAAIATIPILYDGATGVCLQFHNVSTQTYVINTTDSCYRTCDGIWSCSEMICQLKNLTYHGWQCAPR